MRIAVLSSAPSILDEWEAVKGDGWDLTVGISTTCWHIDVDWMCWMDAIAIVGMVERGRRPRIGSVWHFGDFRWAGCIEYDAFPPFDGGRKAPFTLPNALNWAFLRWPHAEVCVFGDSCQDGPNVGQVGSMNQNRALVEMAWIARAYEEAIERARVHPCI